MLLTDPSFEQLKNHFKTVHPISWEAFEAIAEISTIVNIKKGKDLQLIGHTCRTIYFINQGAARIYYYKDQNDITESFAFEGDIIARVESLFTGNPSKKAIQALEDTEVVAIQATPLFRLYDRFTEIERLFRKIFELAYVDTVNRMESIQFHSAEERYTDLLNSAPLLVQRIPLKHVASYLGITQVSLSRIRGQR